MNQNVAKQRRESVGSRTIILRRNGSEESLNESLVQTEQDAYLKSFLASEVGLPNTQRGAPPHIEIMKRMELVDYEPASDIGHFRFYPKGTLMKNLLEDLAEDVALKSLEATKIDTPLLYRAEQKDIAEQAASFHERDYKVQLEDRQLLLRFAGDFGLFSMMKDAQVSHRNLPLRVYEISNSFRFEQSGECAGLKRLRAFTMPDIHCFCADMDSGLEEYARLHKFYDKLMRDAGLPFAIAFRVVNDFWKENKGYLLDRLNENNKDGMVEILDEMKHYWNMKNEFQYIDSTGDNVQLSTVQLDVSDSERYGLMYTGPDGAKKPMVIVHSSMGSIERMLGAVLEERAKESQRGEKPCFPYWLAPTQLRLIPFNSEYIKACDALADRLRGIARTDVDDRNESVGKRVRAAEKEWIPVYAVVGARETESGRYALKRRGRELAAVPTEVSPEQLEGTLREAQAGRPYRESYLDRRVDRQLRFNSQY